MADNVAITPGTGALIAADEVIDATLGTVEVQFMKIMDGTLNGTSKLAVNANGSLPIQGVQSAVQTGTITTATSNITNTGATNFNVATIAMYGTYAGVSAIFEGSPDGTNWFAIQGQRTDTGVVETGPTALANTVRAWDVFIGAWTQIRVRATAWTSGTANVVIMMQTLPSEPAPTVMLSPPLAGGCAIYSFLSTAAALSASIKASAGQVFGMTFFNNTATIAYVRLYNQTTAPATTDNANIRYRTLVPANTSGAGVVVPITQGLEFPTGIGIRATAAVADTDATVLAANAVIGNVFYK